MSITTVVSTKELERQAAAVFEGKTVEVMLCALGLEQFTEESPITDWETVEISGNGYTRFSATLEAGEYVSGEGAYLLPDVFAEFTATSPGYMYESVVIRVDGGDYPHSVITESPNISMSDGQVQTYRIRLIQDD